MSSAPHTVAPNQLSEDMMATCTAQKGFFTLRGCPNPAVSNCASCGKPTCAEHLSPATGFTMCLDCAARQQQGAPTDKAALNPNAQSYDSDWAYRYRTHYYTSYGYSPLYSSSHFHDRDVRSFDRAADDKFDDDARSADFGDR
jgi:hypothetical protein